MRFLMVLFLVICLSLTPLASSARDLKKYTPDYNSYVVESLGGEIYKFVGTLTELENTWDVKRHIILNIFGIIDAYNCSEKLYIVNRSLRFKSVNENIRHIGIIIFVMTSVGTVDTITLSLNIEEVKRGEPIKKFEQGRSKS